MDLVAQVIEGSFAQEIKGLQVWQPLSKEHVEKLRLLWKQSGVLVFRRQSLSEDELANFSARFGDLEEHPRSEWNSTSNPKIVQLSNLRNFTGQEIGGLGAGEIDWHSDQSYKTRPGTGAVLYGVEVPKDGAATYFANLRLAYKALSADLKRRIENLHAIYDYGQRAKSYSGQQPDAEAIRRRFPLVTHRLVYADPVSGEKSLYMDPLTMSGVVGLSDDEAFGLLDDLATHATKQEFVYRHEWQVGDILMWDNATMLHRRDPVGERPRLLKRTTISLPAQIHVIPEGALLETA
jgi:alpha-ketoglutarate-dependent taurine dioxygenase